jgi:hypothetical protein
MGMRLNGRPYAYNDVQPDERIPFDTVQLMEIFHVQGGMMGRGMGGMGRMMNMAHPIHLHGQSFQIVSRTVHAAHAESHASVREGFIDDGWKDTVLVMPGERVRLIKPFQDFKGLFMVHCHNLEHEDSGMMRDLWVG